jgi:hypothetical protein
MVPFLEICALAEEENGLIALMTCGSLATLEVD